MKILGMQKLTLLDYPGRVGAVLFLDGCNFRCPFCQNSSLVLSPDSLPEISREELLRFLKKRQGILEGICITGGEPTIHRELPELIAVIRDFGYLVKLDTNGTNPDMLSQLLEDKVLDYVAMDIKAGRLHYGAASGITWNFSGSASAGANCTANDNGSHPADRIPVLQLSSGSQVSSDSQVSPASQVSSDPQASPASQVSSGSQVSPASQVSSAPQPSSASMDKLLEKVDRSVRLLKDSSIDYEFRTTVVKGIHTEEDFADMARWLEGCPHYYLQSFRDNPEVLLKNHPFSAFTEEELRHFLAIVREKIPQAELRGV